MASNADSPTAAAKVSLATPDDIPELIHIFWEAFSGPAESTFPQTDDGRAWLERSFQNFLGKQSYYARRARCRWCGMPTRSFDSTIPKSSTARTFRSLIYRSPELQGRVLSFAVTHIVKLGQTVVGNSWKRRWSAAEDLPGVSEERLASYFETLAEAHHLTVGNEGHVYIEFLMTKSTSRHKGYATAIVDWITKLADDLDYACYLDGGGRGMGILERAGFVAKDIGHKYNDTPPPCVPMLRVKNKRGW
ncbi:hypothetical protein NUW58_g1271 [Xylaria curta]|uniref:Uncharacterized protein n=1 Tax=Xylaria curta TaxID=42375 RepID=A0ACC1PL57_9PEZI|nr:hypothetical protein NUW58_g1271 [Xylaria curta]